MNKKVGTAEIEEELKDLAETDAQGGFIPATAITVALSIAICPTVRCTTQC